MWQLRSAERGKTLVRQAEGLALSPRDLDAWQRSTYLRLRLRFLAHSCFFFFCQLFLPFTANICGLPSHKAKSWHWPPVCRYCRSVSFVLLLRFRVCVSAFWEVEDTHWHQKRKITLVRDICFLFLRWWDHEGLLWYGDANARLRTQKQRCLHFFLHVFRIKSIAKHLFCFCVCAFAFLHYSVFSLLVFLWHMMDHIFFIFLACSSVPATLQKIVSEATSELSRPVRCAWCCMPHIDTDVSFFFVLFSNGRTCKVLCAVCSSVGLVLFLTLCSFLCVCCYCRLLSSLFHFFLFEGLFCW